MLLGPLRLDTGGASVPFMQALVMGEVEHRITRQNGKFHLPSSLFEVLIKCQANQCKGPFEYFSVLLL